jgi:hypothetical protein
MRLGNAGASTFVISCTEELRHRASEVDPLTAAILTDTYQCDVPLQDRTAWKPEDYRSLAQLAFLHELYDLLPDETLEAVFGKTNFTIREVERFWRVELLQIDEFTDFSELYRADAERLRRLPKTGRRRVDNWVSDALRRASHAADHGVRRHVVRPGSSADDHQRMRTSEPGPRKVG